MAEFILFVKPEAFSDASLRKTEAWRWWTLSFKAYQIPWTRCNYTACEIGAIELFFVWASLNDHYLLENDDTIEEAISLVCNMSAMTEIIDCEKMKIAQFRHY